MDNSDMKDNGTRLSAIVTGCSPWTVYEYANNYHVNKIRYI